jgi:hypothetical protein
MPKEVLNHQPFVHICRFGTVFVAKRCDFQGGVKVTTPDANPSLAAYSSDLAEMIGYHATNVHPRLNGFQGYDCIDFDMSKAKLQ